MECRELTNDLLLENREEARSHLAGCAACRARKAELDRLAAGLEAIGRAAAPNDALVRRIVSRLGSETPRRLPRYVASRRSPWRWLAGAAAAGFLVAALVVATAEKPPAPTAPVVAVPSRPEPTPQEPVEPPRPEPSKPAPRPEPPPLPAPPRPAPDPAPRPEPLPPPPAPAEPRPAPPPAVEPKPRETKPEVKLLAVTLLEGTLELGGKKLEQGKETGWEGELRSERISRFVTADGVRVTARAKSALEVASADPPVLRLQQGEVFCDVPPKAGRAFAIVTADGRVEVTGTQFSVKRTGDHTEVVVTGGEVAVSNEKGESRVPAGNGLALRKGSAPPRPRPADVDRLAAWRRELDGPETPRFRYDFEDGRRPYPWTAGKAGAGPARGFNRGALEAEAGSVNADLSRIDRRAAVYRPGLVVRFRYYAPSGTDLWIQFFSERAKDNFRFDVRPLAHGKWESLELPLSEFHRLADGSKLQDGDRLTWLNVNVAGADGPVWFDDFELVEVHRP